MDKEHFKPRQRVLTDADIEALSEHIGCVKCTFTEEEVLFVRAWLDSAKTIKSEVLKKGVQLVFVILGLLCGIQALVKLGFFEAHKP